MEILVSNSLILKITQQKISPRDTHDKNIIKIWPLNRQNHCAILLRHLMVLGSYVSISENG